MPCVYVRGTGGRYGRTAHMMPRKRVDDENQKFSEKVAFVLIDLTTFAAPNPGQLRDMAFPDLRRKWAYVLKNMGGMDEQDLSQEDELFRGLFEDGRYSKLTAMEKKQYKKSVLEYADVQDAIRCAQEISLKEGREEGREEGMLQGDANARRLLAKNMLSKGLSPSLISEISGLTEDEVRTLAAE